MRSLPPGPDALARTCSRASPSFLPELLCENMETLLAAHSICKGAFRDTPSSTHDRRHAGAQPFAAHPVSTLQHAAPTRSATHFRFVWVRARHCDLLPSLRLAQFNFHRPASAATASGFLLTALSNAPKLLSPHPTQCARPIKRLRHQGAIRHSRLP